MPDALPASLNGKHGVSIQTLLFGLLIVTILISTGLLLSGGGQALTVLEKIEAERAKATMLSQADHLSIREEIRGNTWVLANCPSHPTCRLIDKPPAILRLEREQETGEIIRGGNPWRTGEPRSHDVRRP